MTTAVRGSRWNLNQGRAPTNLLDLLDRVLDKGVVIDAWVQVSLGAIELLTPDARVFVASTAPPGQEGTLAQLLLIAERLRLCLAIRIERRLVPSCPRVALRRAGDVPVGTAALQHGAQIEP